MVTQVWGGVGAAGELFRQAAEWRQVEGQGRETVATGFSAIDSLLPAGGVQRGGFIEWLAGGDAASADAGGAIAIACAVACRLATSTPQASTIVVVDRRQRFYPPAVLPWLDAQTGVAAAGGRRPQLVVARPSRDDDEIWAIDQALRCPGVAAVLAWPGRVHSTAMRRWQLATRASGAVGLLVRGLAGRLQAGEPTWADARIAVAPVAEGGTVADFAVRRLRLSLVGGPWSGGEMLNDMLEERSTELRLDLTNGRESTRRHRQPGWSGMPSTAGRFQDGCFQLEGAACRAS